MKKITVAIAGNPNSGKTTVFNALTGMRHHVGNYPGVTVEKKEGACKHEDYEITFVDLPGTYSLTAYSIEEIVARNFIVDEHPDVVVDIVDSSNLERNLYLAVQLMEMNVPLVLAFNMSDLAKSKGMSFDIEQLSQLLEAAIVPMTANKKEGINELLQAVVKTAEAPKKQRTHTIQYGKEIEEELEKIQNTLDSEHDLVTKYGSRWLALKLLEHDKEIWEKGHNKEVLHAVKNSTEHLKIVFDDDPQIMIADRRYGFISGACQESVKHTVETRHDWSDKIDTVMINRVLGIPIFVILMYLLFQLTFFLGQWPMEWMERFFGWLSVNVAALWPAGSESALKSLIVDGIIGGVGGVIVFLPNILLLFLAIAFLEDSGYMARAAFIMDRIMHKIGLHGKSFMPMLIGLGCSVPAIMATRILENRRNRLTTIMIIPLVSCGARLPIYMLIIPAFFANTVLLKFGFLKITMHAFMLWIIYMIGILLAIICARILRSTVFQGETTPFVMELPPYRMPTLKGVVIHMWDRGWMYLKKAGTIILAISIILWAAASYPKVDPKNLEGLSESQIQTEKLRNSIIGGIGHAIEPIIKPIGFDYKIGTALIGALAAKEVFVAQLGIVYSLGESEGTSKALRKKLKADYSPLQGFCIMLFCLISAPCMATIAMTKRETGSWGWAIFQLLGLTTLAYVVTFFAYRIGLLMSV
ncbi:MAG: ferrous iron transport protein B [Planctomycetes bacterium]|nr:ferrous iron transport protein B [Planctomycetota bacterium]